jgi:ribosomal protein S18 acetylase RimI-like enzyme
MPPVVARAGSEDLAEIRAMLQEYAAWLAIDLSFQDFTRELHDLPGEYAPPGGDLYVARLQGAVVGMVAFRSRGDGRAEMKRLYVRNSARGSGVGHRLVETVLAAARERGHHTMVLDTLPVMQSAQRMYEQFGFRDVPPYYESPIAGTRFMARAL